MYLKDLKHRIRTTPRPQCNAPDCTRNAQTAGYCGAHYQRLKRHGDVNAYRSQGRCAVEGDYAQAKS